MLHINMHAYQMNFTATESHSGHINKININNNDKAYLHVYKLTRVSNSFNIMNDACRVNSYSQVVMSIECNVFCHTASGPAPQLVWPDHLW